MIKRTQIFLKQLVLVIDGLALFTAFVATYFLRQRVHVLYLWDMDPEPVVLGALRNFDSYLWLLFIILPLWMGSLHILGAYRELRVKTFLPIAWIVLKASVLSLLMFGSMVFLLKLHYVSRTFMVLFFILSLSFLCLERAFLIECWHFMSRRAYFHRRLLIVGTGARARRFMRATQAQRQWGLTLMGLIDIDSSLVGKTVEGVQVLGTLEGLPQFLKELAIDEVIFVIPRSWMARVEEAILYCERVGVRATMAADLFNLSFAKAHPSDFDGIPVISFETTPADEWKLALKRMCDFLAAAVGLMIFSPLFLILALLIKSTSPGPIFFRQLRCGVNGRRFTLYKFRSMGVDAEARLAELTHLNEMGGPVFKLANDPRFTPIGRLLRKTSIDELPQLFNVLKGEMSLVGPRPPLPEEVARYEPWQLRRLSMRPGITGFWQVNGRSRIKDFNQWVSLDLRYIDEWSLFLDLKILLKTIPVALFGIGAK